MDMKRILMIAGVLLLLIGIVGGLYAFFSQNEPFRKVPARSSLRRSAVRQAEHQRSKKRVTFEDLRQKQQEMLAAQQKKAAPPVNVPQQQITPLKITESFGMPPSARSDKNKKYFYLEAADRAADSNNQPINVQKERFV